MNCGQFEARLNLILDQRRSPSNDAALASHAAVCSQCEQLLADETFLVASVSQWSAPQPRPGFAHRVVAAAVPAVGVKRRLQRAWFALGVGFSAAAAMLLAIYVVWQARQVRTFGDSEGVTHSAPVTEADILLGAPGFPNSVLGMVMPGGRAIRLDELERVAPGIRPLRESLALIWDALRRAMPSSSEKHSPPPDKGRAELWWLDSLNLALT